MTSTYSGTVSAAFEGTLLGIPSFAVSLDARSRFRFEAAARFAVRVARFIVREGLPNDTFLNINVPNLDEKEIRSFKITQLGRWIQNGQGVDEKVDPRGKKYYWIAGARVAFEKKGIRTSRRWRRVHLDHPLHLDLTDRASLRTLKTWKF